MANCKKCQHSLPYWNIQKQKSESRCWSPHDKSMETKEGEHNCPGFKVNVWDEERINCIGQNGNDGLHYEDIE